METGGKHSGTSAVRHSQLILRPLSMPDELGCRATHVPTTQCCVRTRSGAAQRAFRQQPVLAALPGKGVRCCPSYLLPLPPVEETRDKVGEKCFNRNAHTCVVTPLQPSHSGRAGGARVAAFWACLRRSADQASSAPPQRWVAPYEEQSDAAGENDDGPGTPPRAVERSGFQRRLFAGLRLT